MPDTGLVRILLELVVACIELLAVDAELTLLCTSPAVIVTTIHASDKSVPVAVAVVVELLGAGVAKSKSVAVSRDAESYGPAVKAQTASVVPVILQSSSPIALYMPVGW